MFPTLSFFVFLVDIKYYLSPFSLYTIGESKTEFRCVIINIIATDIQNFRNNKAFLRHKHCPRWISLQRCKWPNFLRYFLLFLIHLSIVTVSYNCLVTSCFWLNLYWPLFWNRNTKSKNSFYNILSGVTTLQN